MKTPRKFKPLLAQIRIPYPQMNPGYAAYLKSDHWQDLRLRKLVTTSARCHFCKVESIGNDVHHVTYPKDLRDTKLRHLRVLCRGCHAMVHQILSDHPGINDERSTRSRWRVTEQHVRRRLGMKMCFPRDTDEDRKSMVAALSFAGKALKASRSYANREGLSISKRVAPMSDEFAQWVWLNPHAHPDVTLLMAARLSGGSLTLKELQKPIRRKLWKLRARLARVPIRCPLKEYPLL